MRRILLHWPLVLVVGLLSLLGVVEADQPAISAELRAPAATWSAPSPVLETLEYLAQGASIFPVISFLTSEAGAACLKRTASLSATPKEEYEEALALFDAYHHQQRSTSSTSPEDDGFERDALQLSLSVHLFAPRIQARYDYYAHTVVPAASSASSPTFQDCPVWVQWDGVQYCDLPTFQAAFQPRGKASPLFDQEHMHGAGKTWSVVLYAEHQSPALGPFHAHLMELVAGDAGGAYILRFKPFPRAPRTPLYLSGYGVELAVKSTEYKVVDDSDVRGNDGEATVSPMRFSHESPGQAGDLAFLSEPTPIIKTLKPRLFQPLGYKMAQFVCRAKDPFAALVQSTQDFPKLAHLFVRVEPDKAFRKAVNQLKDTHPLGLWLNGGQVDMQELSIFQLLRTMRKEREAVQALVNMSFTRSQAISLLASAPSAQGASSLPWGVSFDTRSKQTLWLNNLQTDEAYRHWPHRIEQLLAPGPPGQLRAIRANVFNCLVIVDLTSKYELYFAHSVLELMSRSVPIRFGILPLVREGDALSVMMANVLRYLIQDLGTRGFRGLISHLLESGHESLTLEGLRSTYATVARSTRRLLDLDNAPGLTFAEACRAETTRLGLEKEGGMFLNGKFIPLDQNWQRPFLGVYGEMIEFMAPRIQDGRISDTTSNYLDYFSTLPGVFPRRNLVLFPEEGEATDLRYGWEDASLTRAAQLPWLLADSAKGAQRPPALSVVVLMDSRVQVEAAMLRKVLEAVAATSLPVRLLLLDAALASPSSPSPVHGVWCALRADNQTSGAAALKLWDAPASTATCDLATDVATSMALLSGMRQSLRPHAPSAAAATAPAILVNSKVMLDPVSFHREDFEVLFGLEERRATRLTKKLASFRGKELGHDAAALGRQLLHVDSFLAAQGSGTKRIPTPKASSELASFVAGDPKTAQLRFHAILNPLSKSTQKVARILQVLAGLPSLSVRVTLLPDAVKEKEELPSRFYRYVLDAQPVFLPNGSAAPTAVVFTGLPAEPLLTMGLDTLDAWHVRPVQSKFDLDNLRLATTQGESVHAEFELHSILVQGHALDVQLQHPPRGLQFTLGQDANAHAYDTITMANYGYFQLKALPGVWQLSLCPGRSQSIYDIRAASFGPAGGRRGVSTLPPTRASSLPVVVNDFEGVTAHVSVTKKPGREAEDVLEGDLGRGKGKGKQL